MQLKPEQLGAALKKGLQPLYFISGDEPLQMDELTDAIRLAARQAGFTERELLTVQTGFEWNRLQFSADSFSIFAEKKLIDLRLSGGSPGLDGGKALTAYAQRLPEDTILLVSAGKLAKESLKSRWFQAIDKVGVTVQVWPLDGQDLLRWLGQRLQQRGLSVDNEGIKLLAGRVEGNLLAAAQEVEKLYVLYGAGTLNTSQILAAVSDNSRFDVFKLMDSVLAAQVSRILKILASLQAEGVAAPVVLWALTREARLLGNIKQGLAAGQNRDVLFRNYQVWDKRKQLVNDALQRLSSQDLDNVLWLSAKADRQIKGQESGDAWESLLQICLMLAAVKILPQAYAVR
ncbi:DNA polymerase III subunit delta [Methylosoma difficile]